MTDAEFSSLKWQDLYYFKNDKGFRYLIKLRSTSQDLIETPTWSDPGYREYKAKKVVVVEYALNYDYIFLPLGPQPKWSNSIARIREADLYRWELIPLSEDEKAKIWLSV
jgi:hypothetical protein